MGKRELAARSLDHCGLGWLLRRLGAWHGLLVLNYHRLGASPDAVIDQGVWSATPEAFDAQLTFLEREADIVTPEALLSAARLPRRAVLLTFDDGYIDNHALALPILRDHAAGAVFFVATDVIDFPRLMCWDEIAWMVRHSPLSGVPAGGGLARPVRFDEPDREAAVAALQAHCRQLPCRAKEPFLAFLAAVSESGRAPAEVARRVWMTWDMIREAAASGVAIGGHTVMHRVLAGLPEACQRTEIDACRRRIEAGTGRPMTLFSYPFGSRTAFDRVTERCLGDCGVRFAFSQYGGYQRDPRHRPYDVRRVAVERWMCGAQFRALATAPQVFVRA